MASKTQARSKTTSFTIPGMGSDHCAGLVRTSLNRLDGVSDIQTNIAAHRARVTYDEKKLSAADLKAAIERGGYEVEDGEAANTSRDVREL